MRLVLSISTLQLLLAFSFEYAPGVYNSLCPVLCPELSCTDSRPRWAPPSVWVCQRHSSSTLCVHAKSLQLCLTLRDPMDYSLPGSSVQGILQAKILECVALPSSRASSWSRDQNCISYISCSDRRVLNCWATREVPSTLLPRYYWRYYQIQLENNKNHKN